MPRVSTYLALLGIVIGLVLLWRGSGSHVPRLVASPTLTPGVLNPDVTQATIADTICRKGWTRTIRPPSGYQEDHLISLELGGHPTDRRNLWPEPNPHATEVDRVENELNRLVCSGEITLADGQRRETELKHRSG